MSTLRERMQGVRNFFGEVVAEMKKSTWPAKQELFESTVVVIISMLLLSAFVGISDWVLVAMLRLLVRI